MYLSVKEAVDEGDEEALEVGEEVRGEDQTEKRTMSCPAGSSMMTKLVSPSNGSKMMAAFTAFLKAQSYHPEVAMSILPRILLVNKLVSSSSGVRIAASTLS